MSKVIIAARNQTDVPISVHVTRDGGISGLTLAIKIFNGNNLSEFLDFDDGVFKDAGHADPTLDLTAQQATEAPGLYVLEGGFDLSAITVPTDAKSLLVRYEITAGGETGDDIDTIIFASDAIAAPVWDRLLRGNTHNISTSAGRRLRELSDSGGSAIAEGIAQAGAPQAITLEVSESSVDNFFRFMIVALLSGTGVGQIRIVTAYDGTTKVATVDRAWDVEPDATSEYIIGGYQAAILTADTIDVVQDAVLSDGTPFPGANVDALISSRQSEASALARAIANIAEHDATQAAVAAMQVDVDSLVLRTTDLVAALAFFGATIGTPVTHTPTTVVAGGFTWSVLVAASTTTFTRLT